jgi:hypothetical protein
MPCAAALESKLIIQGNTNCINLVCRVRLEQQHPLRPARGIPLNLAEGY